MVTKQEVMEKYAAENPIYNAPGKVPRTIIEALEPMAEDKDGIYNMASDLLGKREYMTFDEVKELMQANIRHYIKDVQKIADNVGSL